MKNSKKDDEEEVTVNIGAVAAGALMLDGPSSVDVIPGIAVISSTKRTYKIRGVRDRVLGIAEELELRAGGDWDNDPAEKSSCRNASRSIYRQMGIPLPESLVPRKRK